MKREVAPARSRSPSRAAAKHGVDYCIPDMPGDFNDLVINSGIDAVLSLLPKAKVSLKPVPFDSLAEIPPRPWLFGDQLGDDILMFASDYPHGGGYFPNSVDLVMQWEMPDERKRKLFWDNAVKLYARCGLS